jgi:hypothetical protein
MRQSAASPELGGGGIGASRTGAGVSSPGSAGAGRQANLPARADLAGRWRPPVGRASLCLAAVPPREVHPRRGHVAGLCFAKSTRRAQQLRQTGRRTDARRTDSRAGRQSDGRQDRQLNEPRAPWEIESSDKLAVEHGSWKEEEGGGSDLFRPLAHPAASPAVWSSSECRPPPPAPFQQSDLRCSLCGAPQRPGRTHPSAPTQAPLHQDCAGPTQAHARLRLPACLPACLSAGLNKHVLRALVDTGKHCE